MKTPSERLVGSLGGPAFRTDVELSVVKQPFVVINVRFPVGEVATVRTGTGLFPGADAIPPAGPDAGIPVAGDNVEAAEAPTTSRSFGGSRNSS